MEQQTDQIVTPTQKQKKQIKWRYPAKGLRAEESMKKMMLENGLINSYKTVMIDEKGSKQN